MFACFGTFNSHYFKEAIIFIFISRETESQKGQLTCPHLQMGSQHSKYFKVYDISEALGIRGKTL